MTDLNQRFIRILKTGVRRHTLRATSKNAVHAIEGEAPEKFRHKYNDITGTHQLDYLKTNDD